MFARRPARNKLFELMLLRGGLNEFVMHCHVIQVESFFGLLNNLLDRCTHERLNDRIIALKKQNT